MMLTNIDALARDWLEAKAAEEAAKDLRYTIEDQITQALEVKDEGSITHTLDDHKVTLTQPVTRKVDDKRWQMVLDKCPAALHPIKMKIEADAAGCKWLMNNEPEIYRILAEALTVKPASISVTVTPEKEN